MEHGRRLFRSSGFVIEDLIELRPGSEVETTYDEFAPVDWLRDFPASNLEGAEGALLRRALALALALGTLTVAAGAGVRERAPAPDPLPNILVVLRRTTRPSTHCRRSQPAMPWLQISAPGPERPLGVVPERDRVDPALLSVPARRSSPVSSTREPHVRDNAGGPLARRHQHAPRVAAPSRVHDRVGGEVPQLSYPWGRAPFVPPGWDRWFAKENANESTSYYDYDVVDDGYVRHYGATSPAYATDVLAAARRRVRERCADRPSLVPLFRRRTRRTQPWIPADRYRGRIGGRFPTDAVARPDERCAGKPGYVTSRPPLTGTQMEAFRQFDLREQRDAAVGG
jgi:hypothetical protein